MNKLTKMLLIVLAMVLGVALVGCGGDKPEPEPDPIAPTTITVDATIYSGTENSKYVVKDSKMYIEATCEGEEGCDESVTWTIDGDCATLEVEEGVAVITGVKGGNVTVTATSTVDATVKGSYVAEVVDTEDFNEAVVSAKDAMVAALPTYVAADFKLPLPENPNIEVTYKNKNKKVWSDNVFKYAEAYNAANGDVTYAFYVKLSYHGVTKEFELAIKCVGNAVDNDFYALSAAKEQVETAFAKRTVITDKTDNIIDNGNGTYQYELPQQITVDGCTVAIEVEWTIASGNGLAIKDNKYLVYTKPLVDSLCQVNAIYKAKKDGTTTGNNEISKLYLTAAGYTPDEVFAYIKTLYKNTYYNATTDAFVTAAAGFTVPTADTTKKFKLLKVEYVVAEDSTGILSYTAPTGTSTTGTFRKLGTGVANVQIILSYNKQVRKVMVDKFDENGNLVKDEEGKVVQEEVEQIVCDWTKTYDVTITLN